MAYEITQEEIDKILNIEGQVRGVVFRTDHRYIKDTAGDDGVRDVEKRLEEMGYAFNYEKDATDLSLHPVGMRALSLLAISQVLDLDKEDIRNMGRNAPKFSMVIRFFMRYLVSPETIMEKAGALWKKHYTIGSMKVEEIDMEKKYMICTLHDIALHPIFCDYLTAYLEFIVKLGVGEEVTGEETKCPHLGDEYHEFIQRW